MSKKALDLMPDPFFHKAGLKHGTRDPYHAIMKGENLAYSDNSHDSIRNMKIIHWAPDGSLDFTVERPDGNNDSGRIEPLVSEVTGISQFERYGYVNISDNKSTGYFLHIPVYGIEYLP